MSAGTRAWLQIHACVVLWGFTAVFGKLISLAALPLVWWRMALVSAAVVLVPSFWTHVRRVPARMLAIYAGIGVVVALHWLTFYLSVKLANASVAALCMALIPVFISFIEPLLVTRRFNIRELGFGLLALPGVVLVIGGMPSGMYLGFAVGVGSAALAALFGTLNKRFSGAATPLAVTGVEIGAGMLFISLIAPLLAAGEPAFVWPALRDGVLLLVLALGCTLLPFMLSLMAMRHLSAFSTGLAINMEPVYAIVFAIVLLGEQRELHVSFYVGVLIVVAAVFLHPWSVRRRRRLQAVIAANQGTPQ